jgi:hypothetical protein
LLGFNTAFALLKFNDSIVEKLVAEGSAKFKQLQLENEEHIKNKEYDKLNFIINLGSNDHLINHEILTTEKFINNPTKEQSLNNRLQQLYVNSNNTKQCYLLLISYFDVVVQATPPDGLTVEDVFNTGKFYNENSTIKDCKDLHNIITTEIENSLNVDKTKFYYLISLGRYRMVFQKNEKPQSAYTWFSHSNTPANQTPPTYFTETYDYLKQYLISSKDKRYNLRETLVEDYVSAFEQAYKNAPLKAQILNTYTSEGITAILQNFTSTDYYTLSVAERLHCLSVYAGYSMGGSITIINNNEEGYALKLTRYINKNELVQFYTGLAGQSTVKNSTLYNGDKDDKALLVKLISRIDDGTVGGDNYTKLIAIILNHFKTSEDLLDKYMGVSEKELRTIVYYSTDLIPSRSWSMTGRINYDVDLNNDGSLLIDRKVASADYPDVACLFNTDDCATITWEPIDPINDLKIFDLIYFTNCSELSMIEEAGAAKDDEMIAPAVILKYCDDKNFNSNSIQAVSLAFDAVTLIAGPGAIKQAINSRKLVMALYEASQLFSAGGNLVVNVSNDPDLLALKQEYDNIMLYWDMANIIGGTGKIITKINTSVKNGTAKRITKQTGQNFITLYNSAVAAGKTIPTKIKQLYLYLKKKGIDASGIVNTAGNFAEYIRNGFKINTSTLDDAFKHVDDITLNGAGKPTFNSNSLVGCHNEVNFNTQLTNNGGRIEIVSSTPSGVNGIKNIEYKTLKLDNQGNPIPGDYVGNGATAIKTVYDPAIYPEALMKDLGYKSFKDAIDNLTKIDINGPRTFEGIANGRTISGYYKELNGEKIISTWWIKN